MRGPFQSIAGVAAAAGLLLFAAGAEAGISSISAHGQTYSVTDRIPVFVDSSAKTSIIVKGEYMDLCIGAESNDSSFTVDIGQRVGGSNSSVEILVGAGSASDGDNATITINFAMGEETFKIKSYRTTITGYADGSSRSCYVGETFTLKVIGSVTHLVIGPAGAMLDVADGRYDLGGKLATSTANSARFPLKCTAVGNFSVDRSWFRDFRLTGPPGPAIVRGSATFTVTVNPAPPPTKL